VQKAAFVARHVVMEGCFWRCSLQWGGRDSNPTTPLCALPLGVGFNVWKGCLARLDQYDPSVPTGSCPVAKGLGALLRPGKEPPPLANSPANKDALYERISELGMEGAISQRFCKSERETFYLSTGLLREEVGPLAIFFCLSDCLISYHCWLMPEGGGVLLPHDHISRPLPNVTHSRCRGCDAWRYL